MRASVRSRLDRIERDLGKSAERRHYTLEQSVLAAYWKVSGGKYGRPIGPPEGRPIKPGEDSIAVLIATAARKKRA